MKVLLVSLPDKISRYILLVLRVRWPGVMPIHAEAEEALGLLHTQQPDLAILHLPERGDGSAPEDCFGLIDRIREFSEVPLIVVGETDDVMDRVKALETGADDWVSTSFVPMEFIAKVNAILRRCNPDNGGVSLLPDGRLSIDHSTRQVYVSGNQVKLTPIQFEILNHLVKNAGRVCTSNELLQRVWGPGYRNEKEILKLSVHRLRSKIEKDPSAPEIIINERGIGYVIRATTPGK